jgi:hypothetical protein
VEISTVVMVQEAKGNINNFQSHIRTSHLVSMVLNFPMKTSN